MDATKTSLGSKTYQPLGMTWMP